MYLGEPYVSDETIMAGNAVLEDAGGVTVMSDIKTGRTKAAGSGDQPAIAPAIRKKKDTGGATVRGLASGEESGRMTEAELSRIIANEIYEVLYGSTD